MNMITPTQRRFAEPTYSIGWLFRPEALGVLLLALLAVVVMPATAGHVEMPQGNYVDSTEDLAVKLLGGKVRVRRTWSDGEWHINRAWKDLELRRDSLNSNLVIGISRGGKSFQSRGGSARRVFTFRQRKLILTTDTGYRWQNRQGDWIEYDAQGRMNAYGDSNITKVRVDRNGQGHIDTVYDHHGTAVLRFDYDDNGRMTRAHDISRQGTIRTVVYNWHGDLLISVANPVDALTRFEYDSEDRLNAIIDPNGHRTELTYHPGGQVKTLTRPGGLVTDYSYDYDTGRRHYLNGAQFRWAGAGISGGGSGRGLPLGRIDTQYNRAGIAIGRQGNGENRGTARIGTRQREYTDTRGLITRRQLDEWDNVTEQTNPDGSSVSTVYDYRQNRPSETTDENGNLTRYERDDRGNIIRLVEAVGSDVERVTEFDYDAYGQVIEMRRIGVESDGTNTTTTRYAYDDWGNLIRLEDPEGGITEYAFDAAGSLTGLTDANGHHWTTERDAIGRALTVTSPLGGQVRYRWDGADNLIEAEDAQGNVQTRGYDAENRLISITDRLGNTATIERDPHGQPTTFIDPKGARTTLSYDASQRLKTVTDSAGNTVRVDWGYTLTDEFADALGEPDIRYPGMVNAIQIADLTRTIDYDARGRPSRIIEHLGGGETLASVTAYDPAGNLIRRTDAENRQTEYRYDALNRLIEVIDATGQSTNFDYDHRDNLLAVTDPNGHTTTYSYDNNDRRTTETLPGGQQTHYEYDPAGNGTRIIDPDGRTTTYQYDAANRLIRRSHYAAPSDPGTQRRIDFGYDGNSNLASYVDDGSAGSYTYDRLDRLIRETIDHGSFQLSHGYAYDSSGNKTAYQDPDGTTVNYDWDLAGRLKRIDLPGQGSLVAADYNWAQIATLKYPGGSERRIQFDPLQRPVAIEATDPDGRNLLDHRLGYDRTGNILSKGTEHGDYQYAYDELQRLIEASGPQSSEGWSYDANGNRVDDQAHPGDWVYDDQGRLLQSPGASYQYDQAGNTTAQIDSDGGRHWRYHYDAEGRLSQVEDDTTGHTIAEYHYDPSGQRIRKTVAGQTTYYHYSDEGLVGEYDQAGQLKRGYGFAPDGLWSTNPLYGFSPEHPLALYHNDHLGTPQRVTDRFGATLWSARQKAFGRTDATGAFANGWRFGGQFEDAETGLHYNHKRYYNPDIGRYLRGDPIGLAGGLNRYSYAANNPLVYLDPNGEAVWMLIPLALAAVEIGLTIYDGIGLYQLLTDECVPLEHKMIAGGLFAAGMLLPGNYSWAGRAKKKAPCCFVAGTEIKVEDGFKSIEELAIGDEVVSIDVETGEQSLSRVIETFLRPVDAIDTFYRLTVSDGEHSEAFYVTGEHPFWTLRSNGWTIVEALEVGDELLDYRGRALLVVGKDAETELRKTYSITVEGDNNYFAGGLGVLVHNCGDSDDVLDAPKRTDFRGTGKPWTEGATPNSRYHHLDGNGKVKQTAVYNENGKVVGHIDYKNHGKGAPSGHGHQFPDAGNPASGHGKGKPHISNDQLPSDWTGLPSDLQPTVPLGQ